MEKKANHTVPVVRIGEVFSIPGADKIQMTKVGGYELVIPKTMQPGDLAVFIQPDSVVPQTEPFAFIWQGHVGLDGKVPERRRRITVRRFKKQFSEGLLLPLTDFDVLWNTSAVPGVPSESTYVVEGQDVSDILGVTHYEPESADNYILSRGKNLSGTPRRKYPRSLKGWFFYVLYKLGLFNRDGMRGEALDIYIPCPQYDVDALKNYPHVFTPEDQVVVTEKIHGANARYVCIDGTMYHGSRTQWKDPNSDTWWTRALADNPWVERFCRENEGYTLYGEITHGTLVQKGFDYGSDKFQFFGFDIYTPEGKWLNKSDAFAKMQNYQGSKLVPILYTGKFDLDEIRKYVDGTSTVYNAKHIREGVVVAVDPEVENQFRLKLSRKQLKLVSNIFYEKEMK